jgi:hypothetical protein
MQPNELVPFIDCVDDSEDPKKVYVGWEYQSGTFPMIITGALNNMIIDGSEYTVSFIFVVFE